MLKHLSLVLIQMCLAITRLQSIIFKEVEAILNRVKDELPEFISSTPEDHYLNLKEHKPFGKCDFVM